MIPDTEDLPPLIDERAAQAVEVLPVEAMDVENGAEESLRSVADPRRV